jgi:hypothetical protein
MTVSDGVNTYYRNANQETFKKLKNRGQTTLPHFLHGETWSAPYFSREYSHESVQVLPVYSGRCHRRGTVSLSSRPGGDAQKRVANSLRKKFAVRLKRR